MGSLSKKLSALVLAFCVLSVRASGIPVIDAVSLAEAIKQTFEMAKQLSELKNQLAMAENQYKNMLQNTQNLSSFNWDQAKSTIDQILNIQNQMEHYSEQAGSLDGYLEQYQDEGYYSNQPCFNGNACTQADLQALNEKRVIGSGFQKQANDALFKAIEHQQKNLESDAQHLERLQQSASTANGQVEAIQYANQLASQQVNQLLQLRTVFLAEQNAQAVERQQEQDRRAQESAAADQARSGNLSQPSSGTKW